MSETAGLVPRVLPLVLPFGVSSAVQLIDRYWVRTNTSGAVPDGYVPCPGSSDCGMGGATHIAYVAGATCPFTSCLSGQLLGGPFGPPLAEPYTALELRLERIVSPEIQSYTTLRQFTHPGGGAPLPVSATLPQLGLGVSFSTTPMLSPEPMLQPAKPGSDNAIRIGFRNGPKLDLVDKGEFLEIRQTPHPEPRMQRLPPRRNAEVDVAEPPPRIRARREPYRPATAPSWLARVIKRRDQGQKTRLQKNVARALKLYHTLTEVSDAADAIYAALPRSLRQGPKTNAVKAQVIWANLDQINMTQAIYNLVYNQYEDKLVGRTSAQLQKLTGGRGAKALFHGPAGFQMSQFGRELGNAGYLDGVPDVGPEIPSLSKALQPYGYTVGEARTRLMQSY